MAIKQVLAVDYMLKLWPHRLLHTFVRQHFWTHVGYMPMKHPKVSLEPIAKKQFYVFF